MGVMRRMISYALSLTIMRTRESPFVCLSPAIAFPQPNVKRCPYFEMSIFTLSEPVTRSVCQC